MFFDRLLSGHVFDGVMGLIIVANAVTIGMESDRTAKQLPIPYSIGILEIVFLMIYTAEVLLRYYTYRLAMFNSGWVRFDTVLVTTSWISSVFQWSGVNINSGFMGMFRLLRMGKLVRPLRVVAQFRTLRRPRMALSSGSSIEHDDPRNF